LQNEGARQNEDLAKSRNEPLKNLPDSDQSEQEVNLNREISAERRPQKQIQEDEIA